MNPDQIRFAAAKYLREHAGPQKAETIAAALGQSVARVVTCMRNDWWDIMQVAAPEGEVGWRWQLRVYRVERKPRKPTPAEERQARTLDALRQGPATVPQLAARAGVCVPTVKDWLRNNRDMWSRTLVPSPLGHKGSYTYELVLTIAGSAS